MKMFMYAVVGMCFLPLMEQAASQYKWGQLLLFGVVMVYCIAQVMLMNGTMRGRMYRRVANETKVYPHPLDDPYASTLEATIPYPAVPDYNDLIARGKVIAMKAPPWKCHNCRNETVDTFKTIAYPTGVRFEATCSHCKEVVYA